MNKLSKTVMVILCHYIVITNLNSQTFQVSSFDRFNVGLSLSSTEDVTGFGTRIGWTSIKGIGLGLDIISASIDNDFGEDINGIGFSPLITIDILNPLKQETPIEIYGFGRYLFFNFPFEDIDLKIQQSGIQLGIGSSYKIEVNPTIQLWPFAEVSHTFSTLTIKDSFNKISEDDNAIAFGIGVSSFFDISDKLKFWLSPSLNFSEGNSSFGLQIGVIIQ